MSPTKGTEMACHQGVTGPQDQRNTASEQDAIAASELNNLIQIVSGTIGLLERSRDGDVAAQRYFETLHTCVDRAAEVAARLVVRAGGLKEKAVLHPDRPMVAQPIQPDPPNAERCILVVDDEPMALALSTFVLNQAGFAVVTASSGAEALRVFAREPERFSLVLLDLSMPIMDGEETFLRLIEIDPEVAVLLNTGFIEKHRLDRMMKAGLGGYLSRPYGPDEVVEQIRSVIGSRQTFVPA